MKIANFKIGAAHYCKGLRCLRLPTIYNFNIETQKPPVKSYS